MWLWRGDRLYDVSPSVWIMEEPISLLASSSNPKDLVVHGITSLDTHSIILAYLNPQIYLSLRKIYKIASSSSPSSSCHPLVKRFSSYANSAAFLLLPFLCLQSALRSSCGEIELEDSDRQYDNGTTWRKNKKKKSTFLSGSHQLFKARTGLYEQESSWSPITLAPSSTFLPSVLTSKPNATDADNLNIFEIWQPDRRFAMTWFAGGRKPMHRQNNIRPHSLKTHWF